MALCLKAARRRVLPPTSHEGGFAKADAPKSVPEEGNFWGSGSGENVMSLRYSEKILKVRVSPAKGFAMGECVTNWSESVWALARRILRTGTYS